jgi:hypothetical protein
MARQDGAIGMLNILIFRLIETASAEDATRLIREAGERIEVTSSVL